MSDARTSGCICGAVKLEITGEPVAQVYCHCGSCRGWLGAPIHGATLWPTSNVKTVKGADKLVTYKKTEASHRQFCNSCGGAVRVDHPAIAMTDVPSVTITGLTFKPTIHVHYGEKVLPIRDGLPKFKDFPKEFGGSGDTIAE